ncbi:MAG: Lrp/AsnC ligand binding domain-containing protein [Acidobacteria bacterium]|nr:Lrp/AsnC ligand binding domain-containing protein [Acidobacteriota bacterium]
MPAVRDCHRCTGDESFVLKVQVESVAELQSLLTG